MNIRNAFVLLIAWVACLLQACEVSSTRRSEPNMTVTLMSPAEANCRCQGADRYKLVNPSDFSREMKGFRHSRLLTQGSDAISTQPVNAVVPARGTVPLECSIVPDRNGDCVNSVTYQFGGINYPDSIDNLSRNMVINIVQSSTAPFPHDLRPTDACLVSCTGSPGECMEFDASNSRDAPLGREIALMLGNLMAVDEIGIEEILDLASSEENICRRSDMIFEHSVGYNFGNRCEIHGILPAGAGSADVIVPPSLSLTYTKRGAGNFTLSFFKRRAAPVIEFSDSELEHAYGGAIKRLDYHDGKYIAQHERDACFALRVK